MSQASPRFAGFEPKTLCPLVLFEKTPKMTTIKNQNRRRWHKFNWTTVPARPIHRIGQSMVGLLV